VFTKYLGESDVKLRYH